MKKQSLLFAVAGVLASAVAANATQLSGRIYLDGPAGYPGTISSVAQALGVIGSNGISATFTSSLLNDGSNYSGGDASTIAQVLGTIGDTTTTDTSGGSSVGSFVMDLRGFISVDTTGTYTFADNQDDGGAFFLNPGGTPGSGTELADVDGTHPAAPGSGTATLVAGHHYAIEYIAYNSQCCGYNGTTSSGGGGLEFVASITGPGTVTSVVPEPACIGLLGLGGVSLMARRRRA